MDYTHEDLSNNMMGNCSDGCPEGTGYDFVDVNKDDYPKEVKFLSDEDYTTPDNKPEDYVGHGTHCAGIAAATGNNHLGVIGVCPGCRIMPVRAGFGIKYGDYFYGTLENDDVSRAIHYAADKGAKVISMSFGGRDSKLIEEALEYARSRNVVLVAAAGNSISKDTEWSYPAALPYVISVASTNKEDERSFYSNYGLWVDVAAPGGDSITDDATILSTVPRKGILSDPSGYMYLQGTSMATPYVAGLAALILSKDPSLSPSEVKKIIQKGSTPLNTLRYIGTGRVDVNKSLHLSKSSLEGPLITSPAQGARINRDVVIEGATHGSYSIYYGYGSYPSRWIKIASGNKSVKGELAYWNTSGLGDGVYTLKLVEYTQNDKEAHDMKRLLFQDKRNYHKGWPVKLHSDLVQYQGLGFPITPTIADLDGDGREEVIVTASGVYVYDENGTLRKGWPPEVVGAYYGNIPEPGVSAGDIYGDKTSEAVVSGFDFERNQSVNLSCFNAWYYNSSRVKGWPINGDNNLSLHMDAARSYAVLESIGPDNKSDAIFNVNPWRTNMHSNVPMPPRIVIIRGSRKYEYNVSVGGHAYLSGSPVVGDVDNDGNKDIVALVTQFKEDKNHRAFTSTYLYILSMNGTVEEKKLIIPANYDLSYAYFPISSPVLADLNGDGTLEIGFANSVGASIVRFVYYNGTTMWNFYSGKSSFINGIAVGDIDNDGKPEIASSLIDWPKRISYLTLLNSSGGLIWSRPMIGVSLVQPTIGDVDGDAYPDVLTTTLDGYVYAFNRTGGLVKGFPKLINGICNSGVALGDIDGDGKTEVVASTPVLMLKDGEIYVWDTKRRYNELTMDWPMFQGGPGHTGLYRPAGINRERPRCGVINSSVSLNSDVVCDSGFVIAKQDVEFNCNGHALRGLDRVNSTGITVLANNVKVENCNIASFSLGIAVYNTTNATVTNNTIGSPYAGESISGISLYSNHSTISLNRVYRSLYGFGILVAGRGNNLFNNSIRVSENISSPPKDAAASDRGDIVLLEASINRKLSTKNNHGCLNDGGIYYSAPNKTIRAELAASNCINLASDEGCNKPCITAPCPAGRFRVYYQREDKSIYNASSCCDSPSDCVDSAGRCIRNGFRPYFQYVCSHGRWVKCTSDKKGTSISSYTCDGRNWNANLPLPLLP